jgi:hypothetical protein
MSSTYTNLRDPILSLASSLSSTRSSSLPNPSNSLPVPAYLPALDADELRSQVEPIWTRVQAQLDEQDRIRNAGLAKNGESSTSSGSGVNHEGGEQEGAGTDTSRADEWAKKRQTIKMDLIRGWMELVGKEVVVLPIAGGEVSLSRNYSTLLSRRWAR